MQQVGRVLPLNGYLHWIGRHPTGDCPWCPGTRETQLHFQCECERFEQHRTAAHHSIARAVIAALKENTKGWTFYYETPFSDLQWKFKWQSYREKRTQQHRRPDGVAWHAEKRLLYFLEFSRPMDRDDSMAAASARKGKQYDAAVDAIHRASIAGAWADRVSECQTLPLMFGVRGSVEYTAMRQALDTLQVKAADKVLAAGVRAAIEAATSMIGARRAALSEGGGTSGSEGGARRQRGGRRQRGRQRGRRAGAAEGVTG